MQNNKNKVAYNRSVPFNAEAEMYVLGCVIIDNRIFDSLNGKIIESDFYDQRNAYIYRAMKELYDLDRPMTIQGIIEELKLLNYEALDKMNDYLVEIVDSVASTASVLNYIDIIEERAIERKLMETMNNLSNDILDHTYEFNQLLEKTEDQISDIVRRRRTSEFIPIEKAASETLEKINNFVGRDNDLTGLDTGYKQLNKATLGFQKGELTILAARPAVGKSSYALNLALNVAKYNNAHVAFFSLEMSVEALMMRVYAYEANLLLQKIRSGNLDSSELVLLGLAKQKLSKLNIYFDANSSSNIADIRTKCRNLKQSGRLDFVVIDYLQLITSDNSHNNRQEEVAKVSRELKKLAIELDIPVLALSQLSRASEDHSEPQLSDLRESGSIEQDADLVMFIYRRDDVEDKEETEDIADQLNEKAKEELQQEIKNDNKDNMTEVIVSLGKNRQGPLASFDYHFYGARCRFNEQEVFKPIVKKSKRGRNRGNSQTRSLS